MTKWIHIYSVLIGLIVGISLFPLSLTFFPPMIGVISTAIIGGLVTAIADYHLQKSNPDKV